MTKHVQYSKESICVSMEFLPDSATHKYRYVLDCGGCASFCSFAFKTPERLSFASVAKLAGAFSLPCKRLAGMAVETGAPAGLPLPESDASDGRFSGVAAVNLETGHVG